MTSTGSWGVILSGRRVREHMESEKEPAAFVELGERCSRLTFWSAFKRTDVMPLRSAQIRITLVRLQCGYTRQQSYTNLRLRAQ